MITGLIFTVCVAAMALCVLMLWRNERVYAYRSKVIRRIYEDNIAAIENRAFQGLQWGVLDEVEYGYMVTRFWRPLASFFPPMYRP